MAFAGVLTTYISKLNHPLKEIRERSLKLLIAKLRLGWELNDELSGTRQLLESLLAWFHDQQPTLQREALELLLATIKNKSGTYIAREMGIRQILSILSAAKNKISPDAVEVFEDVVETLRFLNTVASKEDVVVPHLNIPDLTSSESNSGTSSEFYNLDKHIQTSKETLSSNGDDDHLQLHRSETSNGIRILLFPWVDLCPADSKTMLMIEDALRLLKSTRRCCRFIRDVFLCDFPAEIFLNRPGIIRNLIAISEGNKDSRPGEALHVLLCITKSLRKRLLQLSCLDLIHEACKISDYEIDVEERVCTEVEQIAEGLEETPREDGLLALRQLPAPLYALETLHAVLNILARNVVSDDDLESDVMDLKELNVSLCLVESLIDLLLDCVTDKFWSADHKMKTHRDISHKSSMVMRLLGDLLMKYRNSFYDEPSRCHHRTAWLRLTSCAEKLLHWAKESALPPSSMFVALQMAQIDPALEQFYPDLSAKIADILHSTGTPIDQEYKAKYRQLKKLFTSMDEAVKIMKNKNSCRNSKQIYTCIKNSIPILEIFQSEAFLIDIADFLLIKTKNFDLNDADWSTVRSIALFLMANNVEWVSVKFYSLLAEMVKSILVGDESQQMENEKCLTLLCDVSILTEVACHGLSSKSREVEESASDIMLYLLRGRLVLSDSCWWRLLASLLPVLPLLHVYAAHDTHLGQAICKSLDSDIAECMGVSNSDLTFGLVRLLFVRCVAVQLDAAHSLCKMLDDERYLPPRESLRADVLLNALKSVKPQDFNVDPSSSPSKTTQTTGLMQILDVLKQDIILDELGLEFESRMTSHPSLEPSLRRNTLQQLSVIIRQQELHETFVQSDGLKVIVAILRMSLTIDDYLAFPECALSCVSIINSVCFGCRHALSKISDLPALLIRVILVFPANESVVTMCAQILALVVWAGFALQELDESRHRIPALPDNVTERTTLPFKVNSYWKSSPNAEHSYVEWLLAEEEWRAAIRVRWWYANSGSKILLETPLTPAPLALRPCARDIALLRAACPIFSSSKALLALENATSHRQVNEALNILQGYIHLLPLSSVTSDQLAALPWHYTKRFFSAPPASTRDANLLVSLLQYALAYMDNVPKHGGTMSWIKSALLGNEASVISLLGRSQLYSQQTVQDSIEMTQVHICIVKVLIKCIIVIETDHDYDSHRMESLLKILLTCLERIDLRNFHMLGYLNELMRCIRYALNSRFCRLSEDTLISCMKITTKTMSGCALGGGQKGQACRLDAMLSLLALLRQVHEEAIPVQRWSEAWDNEVMYAVARCDRGLRPELRAAALHVFASLALYAQLLPQLLQAIENQSLAYYAARVFAQRGEASVVRAAAASLIASVASRVSPKSDIHECDVLEQLEENNFLDNCIDILVSFCNTAEYVQSFELNISLSMLERRSELEVRAQKSGDIRITTQPVSRGRPPTTATLVAAVADTVNNVTGFGRCPVQEWNERGLYRLLFRCASWSSGVQSEVSSVRASACRALVSATTHKCVRSALSGTKDCLHNLLTTLIPLGEDVNESDGHTARAQALLLLASLFENRSAAETIWQFLKEETSPNLLRLILQCLEGDEYELQDAGLYCLTQLGQSLMNKKNAEKTKDESYAEFYDNLKSPFFSGDDKTRYCSGDSARNDICQPEYMAEELCKALINLYERLSSENTRFQTNEEERWSRISSCLSSVLAASARSRQYGAHRRLPRRLAVAVRSTRDALAAHGLPALRMRTADRNPNLRTLYWVLTVATAAMVDCPAAKESFADDNVVVSLNRLWPWCMLTDQLRIVVMQLLFNFTNDCPKAWAAMCVCVCGRSLIGEVCALCVREAALQSRSHPETLLLMALHCIRHCLPHHHCRSIILKSDVMSSMHASCVRTRARGLNAVAAAWARACVEAARSSEGAAAVLMMATGARASGSAGGAGGAMAALAPPLRARLMPAIAHAATHHRHTFLQSPELLELLSGTLLTGDTADIVSAARAVWALAANNHKAKLVLKSAGVAPAVQSALQRMQRALPDAAAERALQLLTYTNTILQSA